MKCEVFILFAAKRTLSRGYSTNPPLPCTTLKNAQMHGRASNRQPKVIGHMHGVEFTFPGVVK